MGNNLDEPPDSRVALTNVMLETAVFGSGPLADVLESAGHEMGFDHFCLVHSDLKQLNVVASQAALSAFEAYERDRWAEVCYRAATIHSAPPGSLYLDHEAVPESLRLNSAIYNDLYVPMKMAHYAGWRLNVAGETWIYSLARSESRGAVTPEEATGLRAVMPYADRALNLALHARDSRVRGMIDFADAMAQPVVVLDHWGHAAAVNSAAEALMGADFSVRERQLWAADPESQAMLQALAHAARRQGGPGTLKNFTIRTRDVANSLLLRPVAIRGLGLDALPGARIVVTLVEPKRRRASAEADLSALFRLTSAEASVAALLAAGRDPQEIANIRGVAVGTIRTQIRQLFVKLKVNRLEDIVAIAMNVVEAPSGSVTLSASPTKA